MVRPASAEISTDLAPEEGHDDWRDELNTPREIMGHVLTCGFFANAELIVGKNKTGRKVIKEILQCVSTPLENRLKLQQHGQQQQFNGEGLPIFDFGDVDLEPMDEVLEFAYTHEWAWSGDISELCLVLKLLRLAEKFGIKILVQKIQKALLSLMANERQVVNEKTVCLVFEMANIIGVTNLKNFALQLILRTPKLVFDSIENYSMLSQTSFIEILEKDGLEVESELVLFQIALTWAKSKCEKLEESANVKNLRKILKPILPSIRFEQMTAQEFLDHVQPAQLLESSNGKWLNELRKTNKQNESRPRKYHKNETPSTKNVDPKKFDIVSSNGTNKGDDELDSKVEVHFHIENFDESQTNELLTSIIAKSQSSDTLCDQPLIDLVIKNCVDGRDLLSFLQLMAAGAQSQLKIQLKVDTILNMTPIKSPTVTKFLQITSLNFESLSEQAELACLLEILQNSPNLTHLSLGNFEWYLKSPEESYANLNKLLTTLISLKEKNYLPKQFKFSCGLFGTPELTKDTLLLLKKEGVSMRTIGLNWSIAIRRFQIIEYLGENLQEIHYLQHQYSTPTFMCNLPKLTTLNILCDSKILASVLKKMPNLQKLVWRSSGSASPSPPQDDKALLPELTSLTLFLRYKENVEQAVQLFANCPKLSQLSCINWYAAPMTMIYEHFGKIRHLQICQGGGGVTTENLIGTKIDKEETNKPYIGNLKELTSLSFGYQDYQYGAFIFKWGLDVKAFTEGICHLSKLEKIIFPPMSLDKAKTIVTILGESKTKISLIGLQTWLDKIDTIEGQEDTMTTAQVEKLAADFGGATSFKIEAMQVRPEDSCRVFLY